MYLFENTSFLFLCLRAFFAAACRLLLATCHTDANFIIYSLPRRDNMELKVWILWQGEWAMGDTLLIPFSPGGLNVWRAGTLSADYAIHLKCFGCRGVKISLDATEHLFPGK